MFYQIYQFISLLLKFDSVVHTAKRVISVSGYLGHFGVACIEYSKHRVDVLWKPQTPSNYLEEVIRLNPNHFLNSPSCS